MTALLTATLLLLILVQDAHAERKVQGTITDKNGNAVEGFRVKAFDHDTLSPDDLMGTSFTDRNGRYEIDYEGGHWDTAPHQTTRWRPDIYVKISMRVDGYCSGGEWDPNREWIHMGDSGVTSNHPLREDLTKDVQLENYPMEMRVENFVLKKNMYCEVDIPGRHSCYACSSSGEKVEWSTWGFKSVPKAKTHCWFNLKPPKNCSLSDWDRIREGPPIGEPQEPGGESLPSKTDERSGR